MFNPSQNMNRQDVLQSIMRRFNLSYDIGRNLLDLFYPIAFWRVISCDEYQKLIGEMYHPTNKKIIALLKGI